MPNAFRRQLAVGAQKRPNRGRLGCAHRQAESPHRPLVSGRRSGTSARPSTAGTSPRTAVPARLASARRSARPQEWPPRPCRQRHVRRPADLPLPGHLRPAAMRDFYVDRRTGAPVGSQHLSPRLANGHRFVRARNVQVHLNRRGDRNARSGAGEPCQGHHPVPARRRDRNGCIRGPSTDPSRQSLRPARTVAERQERASSPDSMTRSRGRGHRLVARSQKGVSGALNFLGADRRVQGQTSTATVGPRPPPRHARTPP